MIRSDHVREMQKLTGGKPLITTAELMDYLRIKDRHTLAKYLEGIHKVGGGYPIDEVAYNIMRN